MATPIKPRKDAKPKTKPENTPLDDELEDDDIDKDDDDFDDGEPDDDGDSIDDGLLVIEIESMTMVHVGPVMGMPHAHLTPDVYGLPSTMNENGHLVVQVPKHRIESELGREHGRMLTLEQYDDYLNSQLDDGDDDDDDDETN